MVHYEQNLYHSFCRHAAGFNGTNEQFPLHLLVPVEKAKKGFLTLLSAYRVLTAPGSQTPDPGERERERERVPWLKPVLQMTSVTNIEEISQDLYINVFTCEYYINI